MLFDTIFTANILHSYFPGFNNNNCCSVPILVYVLSMDNRDEIE